ncbi:MAG TPA: hypothetical protein VMV23_02760 [Candidatus Nanopelagicaceae bacterium]|nr:hypothetical protein [Candidatus Nanopelagicaceae bacterium]
MAADIREMGTYSVERAAQGWDRLVGEQRLEELHQAEKEGIHLIEEAGRSEEWNRARRSLFGLTEGGDALVTWQAEHGEIGHKAERAAFAAALALIAEDKLQKRQLEVLLAPMAEALPWLLGERTDQRS